MIIFIIDGISILAVKTEGKAPIGADLYRPGASTIANQFVQIQTGELHILRTGGSMQAAQYVDAVFQHAWANANQATLSENVQPLCLKLTSRNSSVTRIVSSVDVSNLRGM